MITVRLVNQAKKLFSCDGCDKTIDGSYMRVKIFEGENSKPDIKRLHNDCFENSKYAKVDL